MYIAQSQEDKLHWLINKSEVALRSFIADIIIKNYPTEPQFKSHLEQIKISDDIVFSKRLKSKIAEIIKNSTKVYQAINICHQNLTSKKYNNDVPYVSFLFDLIMVFFNKNFAGEKLIKNSLRSKIFYIHVQYIINFEITSLIPHHIQHQLQMQIRH